MNAHEFFRGYLLRHARLLALALAPDLTITDASPACVKILGLPRDALVGKHLYELLVVDDVAASQHFWNEGHFYNETVTMRAAESGTVEIFASFVRDDSGSMFVGEPLDQDVRSRDVLLEVHKRSFSLAKNIEELDQRNKNLEMVNQWLREKSVTDPHTALYKRNHLDQLLRAEWNRAKRYLSDLSFMLVGIDGLRALREVQGPDAAARVVRGVARVLDGRKRLFDTLGHFDNETFFLILPHTAAQGAFGFGQRLVSILENREIRAAGYPFRIHLSVGTATYHYRQYPLKSHDELLHTTTDFLNQAQLGGGNQVFNRQSPLVGLRAVTS